MKRKDANFKCFIACWGLLLLSVAVIIVMLCTDRLTTPTGEKVFHWDLAAMGVFAAATALFGIRWQRKALPAAEPDPVKQNRRRNILLMILTWVLTLGAMCGGIVVGERLPARLEWLKWTVLLAGCAVLGLVFLLNRLLARRLRKQLKSRGVQQMQDYLRAHREAAAEASARLLKMLRRRRRWTDLGAVMMVLLGCVIGAAGGTLYIYGEFVSLPVFVCAFGVLCGLHRTRFPVKLVREVAEIDPEEYPTLFAAARKAAEAVGCRCRIRICLIPGADARMAMAGDTCLLCLGVLLLETHSEQELEAVLLHEFAHTLSGADLREAAYYGWIGGEAHRNYTLRNLTRRAFAYTDCRYELDYMLYLFTVSMLEEEAADRIMAQHAHRQAAASSLLRLNYMGLFDWARQGTDHPCGLEEETLPKDVTRRRAAEFDRALADNEETWRHLTQVEILSRTASHPTVRMRLEAMGIREFRLLPVEKSPELAAECEKAVDFVEGLLYRDREKNYEQERRVYYLEPMERVERWQAAGEPLVPEEYADVLENMLRLGRISQAEKLCDRVMEELDMAAAHTAWFHKGVILLHRLDPAGRDCIYHAMEHNHNYLEEGLDMIGQFCCMTGDQAGLDEYRERAVILAQAEKDKYSQIDALRKGDRLSAEHLPEGMLEALLAFIRSVDKGIVQTVHLVRKTVTDDFFTSAVIVRLAKNTSDDDRYEIMHQIFRYLDTSTDWQFSLFDYDDPEVMKSKAAEIPGSLVYRKD